MTTLLLVFARTLGVVARGPGFSHPAVPPPVRVGLALALAGAVAPSVAAAPRLDPVVLALAAALDLAVGAAIGTGAALLYDAAYFAGRFVDDYLGVRASVPTAQVTSAQAFGRLWASLFLVAYFLCDGWVPVVRALSDSFTAIPVAGAPPSGDWWRFALALPTTSLRAALLVAAPAVGVALAAQLALAAVTRVVPRFASFPLAFPVVLAAALVVTLLAAPLLAPAGARPWLIVPWSTR